MYKIINNLAPDYLSQIIPNTTARRSSYVLRTSNNLTIPRCRLERYRLSFVPKTVSDWNNLPYDLRNSPTLSTFKVRLRKELFTNVPNKLFYVGKPIIVKYHTRLRLGLSPLRGHLYSHHIIENSTCCLCSSEAESTDHYFFHCPMFTLLRTQLFSSLINILGNRIYEYTDNKIVHVMLNGDTDLSYSLNLDLFAAVHHFIEKSQRFKYVLNDPF